MSLNDNNNLLHDIKLRKPDNRTSINETTKTTYKPLYFKIVNNISTGQNKVLKNENSYSVNNDLKSINLEKIKTIKKGEFSISKTKEKAKIIKTKYNLFRNKIKIDKLDMLSKEKNSDVLNNIKFAVISNCNK